jgi:hypothetical protein
MVAMDSRSSRSSGVPYAWVIPIRPGPSAETVRPWLPRVRVLSVAGSLFLASGSQEDLVDVLRAHGVLGRGIDRAAEGQLVASDREDGDDALGFRLPPEGDRTGRLTSRLKG